MKLIFEDVDHSLITPIVESKSDGAKGYYLTGPFAEAVTTNRNNRRYPKSVLENAVKKYMPMVEARRALGELNHPPSPQINPKEASHIIQSLVWEGNLLIGRAKILDTPNGRIVKALMDENVQIGMSTRGTGSMKLCSDGVNEVQDDYVMNTVDIVVDPSGISCFVNGVMENVNWIYEASTNSWIKAEQIKQEIKRGPAPSVEKQIALFESFLRSLK